jgi:hypothetical protein
MANGSIRIKSETEYVIEVNDNGDTISFDVADTGLASRMAKTFEKIEEITKDYEAKAAEIDARPDEPYITTNTVNTDSGEIETTTIITKNQYDGSKLIDQMYVDARATLDLFLGNGACQKIFGDKNYYGMFNDLSEQMKPHFEAMGINAEKLKQTGVAKYCPNRGQHKAMK